MKYHAHLLEQRPANKLDTAKLEARVQATEKGLDRLRSDVRSESETRRKLDRIAFRSPEPRSATVWPGYVSVFALIVALIALVLTVVS